MRQEQFQALMPMIVADLIGYIILKEGVSEENAIQSLYESKLYEMLEEEEMKLWHYSTPMLYSLYKQEQENGNIEFPDV